MVELRVSRYHSIDPLARLLTVSFRLPSKSFPGLPRVGEIQNFLHVREKSGNFEKMSGNFGHFIHVSELSGNFVMSCHVRELSGDFVMKFFWIEIKM